MRMMARFGTFRRSPLDGLKHCVRVTISASAGKEQGTSSVAQPKTPGVISRGRSKFIVNPTFRNNRSSLVASTHATREKVLTCVTCERVHVRGYSRDM